ncbi:MAG TPA: type II secretion system protein [Pyrinomonadaceae bacterium]|nr:type II secretion system protein [Pyrinomonadaceae bacterium]
MKREQGFSLIELVITVTVLTILSLGAMPLVKVAVRRQKEQQLRDSLRQIRMAIDEFHRDTVGMTCVGAGTLPSGGPTAVPVPATVIDPRSKVSISDCTIFGVDNPDHFPPDLETLVNGVNVIPRGINPAAARPGVPATQINQLSTKQKIYLRALPIDPMTGKAEWELRSSYDPADSGSWGGENVFDVRSKSKATALNGEKYSDW